MKPELPTFKLTIVANNQAGEWTSWDAKKAAIRAFYSPNCNLDITFVKAALTPKFVPLEPNVYRVDSDWYAEDVVPLATGADIVMFVVPASDHTKTTPMGIETGKPLGIWQTTVFCDESTHTYIGVVDQGDTFTVYALHELSHTFYAMLGKTDNTHLYFYAGTPEKVLADLNFAQEIGLYSQVVGLLDKIIAMIKPKSMPQATLTNLATAIRDYEGQPGDLNYLLNNPGDCRPSPDGYLPKYEPVEIINTNTDPRYPYHKGEFAKFPSYEIGWMYLCNLLRTKIENHPNWSILQLMGNFAPAGDSNDPTAYAGFVAKRLGVGIGYQIKNIEI